MRDVGDRDDEMPAAGIRRVEIRLGPDCIVEVARVAAVDRHEFKRAQIDAVDGANRFRGGGFGERCLGKDMRDLIAGDRDQADRAGCFGRAEPFGDLKANRSITSGRQGLRDYQLAIERSPGMGEIDKIFAAIAPVGRIDAAAVMDAAIDADDAP
jgi:hypothetical protein